MKIIWWENLSIFLSLFLQIWQAVYFTLCIVNDFIGTNEFHPKRPSALRKLKDYVFAAFAFPLALNVAISFWSIYAVDRELILPKSFDAFFPMWVQIHIHWWIVFFSLILNSNYFFLKILNLQMVESYHAYKCGIFHIDGAICDIPSISKSKAWHNQFIDFHAWLRDLDSCH